MFAILFLAYGSLASTLIVAVITFLYKNKVYDSGSNILRIYFYTAAVVDLFLFLLQSFKIHNIGVMNVFCLIQFLLIALALTHWMKYNNLKKVVRIFCLLTFTILTIKVFSNIDSKEFDIPSLAIENSILLLISATVLVNLTGDTEQYLFKNYRFWMALAVFMYFSVSTIVFATGNFLLDDHVYLRRYTWIIHSILSMVANLLYIKGILCLPNKKK